MNLRFRHISILAVGLSLIVSCNHGTHVIPASKLSKIYAEMFATDEWIQVHDLRRVADTMLVYEPILEKYGYTTDDYRVSVDKYLEDPGKMVKIIKSSRSQIGHHLQDLIALDAIEHRKDSLRSAIGQIIPRRALLPLDFKRSIDDGLSFKLDTICFYYPDWILKDEVPSDTLALQDSVKLNDTKIDK